MKLYATTTSERASKGQGGNNYIEINIKDEKERIVCNILVLPKEKDKLENKTRVFVRYNSCAYVIDEYRERLEQKGKSQKGDTGSCEHKKRLKRLSETPYEDIICGDCGAYLK